jgi:hypothetical protein
VTDIAVEVWRVIGRSDPDKRRSLFSTSASEAFDAGYALSARLAE